MMAEIRDGGLPTRVFGGDSLQRLSFVPDPWSSKEPDWNKVNVAAWFRKGWKVTLKLSDYQWALWYKEVILAE